MHGPLDHVLDARSRPELTLLTTDADTGTISGAVALGPEWNALLCELVLDVGRRARSGPGDGA